MIAVEVLGAVILGVLLVVATWMAVVGLMGAVGATRLKRCRSCGHLLTSYDSTRPLSCPYCRHPWFARHVLPVHLRHYLPGEMGPATPAKDVPQAPAH